MKRLIYLGVNYCNLTAETTTKQKQNVRIFEQFSLYCTDDNYCHSYSTQWLPRRFSPNCYVCVYIYFIAPLLVNGSSLCCIVQHEQQSTRDILISDLDQRRLLAPVAALWVPFLSVTYKQRCWLFVSVGHGGYLYAHLLTVPSVSPILVSVDKGFLSARTVICSQAIFMTHSQLPRSPGWSWARDILSTPVWNVQGCHLIPLFCILAFLLPAPVVLSVLIFFLLKAVLLCVFFIFYFFLTFFYTFC